MMSELLGSVPPVIRFSEVFRERAKNLAGSDVITLFA